MAYIKDEEITCCWCAGALRHIHYMPPQQLDGRSVGCGLYGQHGTGIKYPLWTITFLFGTSNQIF